MYKFIVAVCFLLAGFVCSAQSQTGDQLTKSLDSLVAPQFEGNQPGISILIAKKGQVVYKKAFAAPNIELNVPMQPDMIFRIGSITKQFTAVAILQLVEQGKISLQDSVQKYIKDFPSKGSTITVENLLTHISGLADYTSIDSHDPYSERRDYTPEFLIDYFKKEPLQFKPGTKYGYSNSNYLLLGYIVQLVSGESYHQYMADKVIKPAGLTHTLYAEEPTAVPGRVEGYTRDPGFFENCTYQTLSIGFGCGDLLSNTEDLYKWNNAVNTYKLISKESVARAFTPYKLSDGKLSDYGYGWFIDTLYGSLCIHHEGQTSGFIALEKYFPREDTYAAILTNVKSSEDKTDFSESRFRLFDEIGQLALGKSLTKNINVPEAVLDEYLGAYQVIGAKNILTVYKKDGKLYGDLSNGSGKNLLFVPLSETKFVLPDIKATYTTVEFVKQNGKVVKAISVQGKPFELKKIK